MGAIYDRFLGFDYQSNDHITICASDSLGAFCDRLVYAAGRTVFSFFARYSGPADAELVIGSDYHPCACVVCSAIYHAFICAFSYYPAFGHI